MRTTLLAALALAGAIACREPDGVYEQPAPEPDPTYARLYGRALDSAGNPVARVIVTAIRGEVGTGCVAARGNSFNGRLTVSDSNGRYGMVLASGNPQPSLGCVKIVFHPLGRGQDRDSIVLQPVSFAANPLMDSVRTDLAIKFRP